MKKIVLLVTALCFVLGSTFAYAAGAKAAPAKKAFSRPYGMAGCGLGSMVVGKRGGQIFAATTNGTLWNQTFGITFGISNCIDDPNSQVAQKMDNFVNANKVALAGGGGGGNGEALSSLLSIMGCNGNIGGSIQKNFNQIFPSTDVTPNEITDSIITVIKSDQTLAASCKQIS